MMPRSTMGGDDPGHTLPPAAKDKFEQELRDEAKRLRTQGKPKDARKRLDRADHVSRKPSKKADHH